jgi:hypothetical protein
MISFTQLLAEESPSARPPPEVPAEIAAAVITQPPIPVAVTEPPPVPAAPPAPRAAPAPAPTLLPVPQNLRPERGVTFGFNELQSNRNIVFRWAAVGGANAYIFSLYQQTSRGRQEIVSSTVDRGTSYTLDDLRLLDRGNFIWQVEAVNMTRGTIQRRGRAAENTFSVDFPTPRPVQIEDTGTLYGN